MTTLGNAKMKSLKDKIEEQEEEIREKTVKVKKIDNDGENERVRTKVKKL